LIAHYKKATKINVSHLYLVVYVGIDGPFLRIKISKKSKTKLDLNLITQKERRSYASVLEKVYTWDFDNDNSGIAVDFSAAGSGPKAAGSATTSTTSGPGSNLTTAPTSRCGR
jgi:hypothetical protein